MIFLLNISDCLETQNFIISQNVQGECKKLVACWKAQSHQRQEMTTEGFLSQAAMYIKDGNIMASCSVYNK